MACECPQRAASRHSQHSVSCVGGRAKRGGATEVSMEPRPFALRYRRACSGRTRNIEVSLCPLCLCALCVQRELPGIVLRDIDVCCWKAAFDTEDTEDTEAQRT